MGLFGGKSDDAAQAPEPVPAVFEPGPLEAWESGEAAGVAAPLLGTSDYYSVPSHSPAAKGAVSKPSSKKGRYDVRPPEPGLSEEDRRTALRAQMAELTRAYKDAPLEEMEDAIKLTLVAYGQDVPDDWVATIADGLRRNGPTRINYGGPGREIP